MPLPDLSMNLLGDAKISQKGKGQHSCWSQTKIRFSQSLEECFWALGLSEQNANKYILHSEKLTQSVFTVSAWLNFATLI